MKHFLLGLICLTATAGSSFCAESAADRVSVRFVVESAKPVAHSAAGFLHAMTVTEPPSEMLEPLNIKWIRKGVIGGPGASALDNYPRITSLGARIHFTLSDSFGCLADGPCPGDDGKWESWRDVVRYWATIARQKDLDWDWDIWNEPNLKEMWGRDEAQYLQMWREAYLTLREVKPKGRIIGPSTCGYDEAFIERFLTFCKEQNCLPDVLCWHEFGKPDEVGKNTDNARKLMHKLGLQERPLSINEYIFEADMLKPGFLAQFIGALEYAGVDSACHACWFEGEAKTINNCFNNSLNGILTHETHKPRSTWWVYNRYAQMRGYLGSVKSSSPEVSGLATRHKEKRFVLLGRESSKAGSLEVTFEDLTDSTSTKAVQFDTEVIRYSGLSALPYPQKCGFELRKEADLLILKVENVGPHDAVFITVTLN